MNVRNYLNYKFLNNDDDDFRYSLKLSYWQLTKPGKIKLINVICIF